VQQDEDGRSGPLPRHLAQAQNAWCVLCGV